MRSDERRLHEDPRRPWALLILGAILLVPAFIGASFSGYNSGFGGYTPPFSPRSLILFIPGLVFIFASMYDFRRRLSRKIIGHR